MELRAFYKDIEPDDETDRYVRRKMDRLARHLKPLSEARVEVSRNSTRSKEERIAVQVTLTAGGRTLRARETGPDVRAAIDAVVDIMDRQIDRYKGRFYRTFRGRRSARASAREASNAFEEVEDQDADPAGADR